MPASVQLESTNPHWQPMTGANFSSEKLPLPPSNPTGTIGDNSNPMIPTSSDPPPFKEFQQVLAFISSIGLATAASCAFSSVGATSVFGDTSAYALSQIKRSGILLSWASACFIIALCFIAGTQLLYTDPVIISLSQDGKSTASARVVTSIGLQCFAWTAFGFQMAAMILIGIALHVFAPGPMRLANYGMVGCILVVAITQISCIASQTTRVQKLYRAMTCGLC